MKAQVWVRDDLGQVNELTGIVEAPSTVEALCNTLEKMRMKYGPRINAPITMHAHAIQEGEGSEA